MDDAAPDTWKRPLHMSEGQNSLHLAMDAKLRVSLFNVHVALQGFVFNLRSCEFWCVAFSCSHRFNTLGCRFSLLLSLYRVLLPMPPTHIAPYERVHIGSGSHASVRHPVLHVKCRNNCLPANYQTKCRQKSHCWDRKVQIDLGAQQLQRKLENSCKAT